MEHIIQKILEHSSLPFLSPQDRVTGCSIVDQLEKDCQWDYGYLPSYMTIWYRNAFEEMKKTDGALSTLYYSIVYIEAYTDTSGQHHMSRVVYIPFGYWRSRPIGIGNGSTNVHWRAYAWSNQKHKSYPTYEHLTMQTVSPSERDAGLVAYGYGDDYTECAAFPRDISFRSSVISKRNAGIHQYISDVVAEKIRERKAFRAKALSTQI